MNHGSLFSGIGGFDLAAEWMGWENVFHCEINEYCQKILKQHWPNSIGYEDIKKTSFKQWNGKVDVISGGFPCQPFSVAGQRKGTEDDRHLWPEMLRAIAEIQPRWVVGENVPGIINWSKGLVFEQVQANLEDTGFEVFPPIILPACGINANHRRDRLWIVAANTKKHLVFDDTSNEGSFSQEVSQERFDECITIANTNRCEEYREQRKSPIQFTQNYRPTVEPGVRGGADGVPNWSHRIKALGNAVVPQLVYQIFKAIEQYEFNPRPLI